MGSRRSSFTVVLARAPYLAGDRYRLILFDQRGCGRSTPNAGDTLLALKANTTSDLLADIEQLRELRRVERWLLFGGSWGVTLGLAYAEAHPDCVSEAVFFSITAGLRKEFDWITRQAGRFFPEAWERFRNGVPGGGSPRRSCGRLRSLARQS
jgi:proline iminopeptidase